MHSIPYFLILVVIFLFYRRIYQGVQPGNNTPDTLANVIQNTISAGLIAVSIVLPLTVGILGYAVKEKIDCINLLFAACIFFGFSTCAALWNLFRLPGLVTTLNIANDFQTTFIQLIQLFSLFYGFLYLFIGALSIVQS